MGTPGDAVATRSDGWRATLVLRRTRALVRRPRARAVVVLSSLVYAFVAAGLTGMLVLPSSTDPAPLQVAVFAEGTPAYEYPLVTVSSGGLLVTLPLLATALMAVAAGGVGLGMGAALELGLAASRISRRSAAGAGMSGILGGVTPLAIGALTLGACCSTGAAASAGLLVLGPSGGSVASNPLLLGGLQLSVLYLALLAQERLAAIPSAVAPAGPAGSETDPASVPTGE